MRSIHIITVLGCLIGGVQNAATFQAPVSPQKPVTLLTELRGRLARRREYDLWLIRNVINVMSNDSRQGAVLAYCMATVYGAEQSLNSAPEVEYTLRPDGTVLMTEQPKTPEQAFRDGERKQLQLETGGGPVVQDCASSLFWFGTWRNQPMPSYEKFVETAATIKADVDEIDKLLDPRLVEELPKPVALQEPKPRPTETPVAPPVTTYVPRPEPPIEPAKPVFAPTDSTVAALASLPHGLYLQCPSGWKKLESVNHSVINTKRAATTLLGIRIPPSVVEIYVGLESPNQSRMQRPVFGIRMTEGIMGPQGPHPRDFLIVRMKKTGDHRELEVALGSVQRGMRQADVITAAFSEITASTFTLAPSVDLSPGEYLLTLRYTNGASGYDFSVK